MEIQEGSNFILFKNKENEALKSILPNQIYSKFQINFASEYETSKKKCKGNTENPSGCWRDYVLSDRPYSFSMDSIFINPKFSKIVQDIDFKNVRESRSRFLNGMKVDFNTNWYEWISEGDPKRANSPYFIYWEFPKYLGGDFCIKGKYFIFEKNNNFFFKDNKNFECIEIKKNIATRILAYNISSTDQLQVKYKSSQFYFFTKIFKLILLTFISIIFIRTFF